MIREIVFDTETTGLSPEKGDKLVEIGAVELINHLPTGKVYHQYINPQRDVPEEVVKVHGLTEEFLKDYPIFSDIAQEFMDFVGDDGILVAHNASFDMGFINHELSLINKNTYKADRVIDTLEIAKNMFPGSRNNLDALCKRFNIDNTKRTKHGALLDAELLAEVYLHLLGGEEPSMNFDNSKKAVKSETFIEIKEKKYRESRKFELSEQDLLNHKEFMKKIKNPLWSD